MGPEQDAAKMKGLFRLGMIQKLVLINILVYLVFGMIVLAVLFMFRNMESLSKNLVANNITMVIENAQLGREINRVLADTDLFVARFLQGKKDVKRDGNRIVAAAEAIEAESITPHLKKSLHNLTGELFVLVQKCALVREYSEKLEARERRLDAGLASLEKTLSEKLVSLVLEGKDASITEQLSIIIPGYRETLLRISIEHLKLSMQRNVRSDEIPERRLVSLLDDFHLRLRTLTASEPEIAAYGIRLMDDVAAYRRETRLFVAAVKGLEQQLRKLDALRYDLVENLKTFDAQVADVTGSVLRRVTHTMESSRTFIISGSAVVIALLGLFTAYFILTNIRRPMRLIRQGIEAIRRGDLGTRIHLDRNDEWSVIEHALNDMVTDLQSSYEELRGMNRELSAARTELQDKVRELESEIGERQRAEEKLKSSERKWYSLYENLPGGSFTVNKNYIIEDVNDVLCSISGFSKEELIGRKCDIICPKGPHKCPIFDLGKDLIENDETAVKDRDGKLVPIIKSARRISVGEQDVIVENFQDITDRKQLEEQLNHARKMEAVGQLAGGVAHDFNNILTAILGYATLLRMQLPADDPAWAKVEQIIGGAERAADLTRSLLAMSRKQVMELRPFDLSSCVAELQGLLMSLVPEDIEFTIDIADENLIVMGDKSQLEQILINLVSNARDSMPDGGTLGLRLERCEIDDGLCQNHASIVPGMYVVLSVSDTGVGMDEQTRERIFEPFYTTKAMGKGTGLGLAIVYGIVQQHNGHICVSSEPGSGSVFTIFLRDVGVKTVDSPVVEKSEPIGGGETILLAEDEQTVRDLVRSVLEEFGYSVMLAENGEEALRVFEKNSEQIDLLLFDVIMPKKNGKEAYDLIRKLDPSIPALFMSGYTGDVLNNKGVHEEGLNFLAKPVSPEEILRKIRIVLDA